MLLIRHNPDVEIDLVGADLRDADLVGADLVGADLRDAYLRGADLSEADLRDADLRDAILERVDLRDANLESANLESAILNGANLESAILNGADLRDADLMTVQASATDFRGANLTGVCIEDWHINRHTNLKNVICHYIYLKEGKQERRPSDPNRNFEPGEFADRIEDAIASAKVIGDDETILAPVEPGWFHHPQ